MNGRHSSGSVADLDVRRAARTASRAIPQLQRELGAAHPLTSAIAPIVLGSKHHR
jgi:hypothetical protein